MNLSAVLANLPANYRKSYEAGWRYSSRESANLDYADSRGYSSDHAWMDGYEDMAAGRPKWSKAAERVVGTVA